MAAKKTTVKKEIQVESKSYVWSSIAYFLVGGFLAVTLFGFESGIIGDLFKKILRNLFGWGAFIIPFFIIACGGFLLLKKRSFWSQGRFYGWLGVLFFGLCIVHQLLVPVGFEVMPESLPNRGGLFAGLTLLGLHKYLGQGGTWLVIGAGFGISFLYVIWPFLFSRNGKEAISKEVYKESSLSNDRGTISRVRPTRSDENRDFFNQDDALFPFEEDFGAEEINEFSHPWEKPIKEIPIFEGSIEKRRTGPLPWEIDDESSPIENFSDELALEESLAEEIYPSSELSRKEESARVSSAEAEPPAEEWSQPLSVLRTAAKFQNGYHSEDDLPLDPFKAVPVLEMPSSMAIKEEKPSKPYQLPPLSILKGSSRRMGGAQKEIREKALLLEKTLEEFGVRARVIRFSQGPAVTQFEIEPAPGVKVNKILNLADDLALKLAASGIRIEAPIPGKAVVGIEVPNQTVSSVALKDVLETPEFKDSTSKLSVGLGKDIAGAPIIADLAKMPHMLVAGATGSGKSVCINTLITSILFKALPTEVKFILIDPKVVELTHYNGIPHLLTPVVNDPKKAAKALQWAVREMERRYTLFAAASVRDLGRYNELAQIHGEEKIPQIVVIIDELADLMMVAPVEVQDAICRLAQMARAAGIHLILATQRPSVDVITGLIKANIPSRIAFSVSSQIDSRTILDMGGAEKLLGKGDMLFSPAGMAKPLRVQGAFISDDEVERLLTFVKGQITGEPEYAEGVTAGAGSDEGQTSLFDEQDELWEDALRIVIDTGQASASMLQRRFRIGNPRAARLVDVMEQCGIVGPSQGSKPRELMMSPDQIYQRFLMKDKNQ